MDVCRKRVWHPSSECENSDEMAARQARKIKSDLFQKNGATPPALAEIMLRNAAASPLLQLPPEIRLKIYKMVLGGNGLWIGLEESKVGWDDLRQLHKGGGYIHVNMSDALGTGLDLRLLRVCRHVFCETALLPYALNQFTFQDESVARAFGRLTRPGKKVVQKKAIGEYEVSEHPIFDLVV